MKDTEIKNALFNKRALWVFGICGAVFVFTGLLSGSDILESWELNTLDARVAISHWLSSPEISEKLLIVTIDPKYQEYFQKRWHKLTLSDWVMPLGVALTTDVKDNSIGLLIQLTRWSDKDKEIPSYVPSMKGHLFPATEYKNTNALQKGVLTVDRIPQLPKDLRAIFEEQHFVGLGEDRDGRYRWAQLVVKESQFVFNTELEDISDLDNGRIPDNLQQAFEKHDLLLPKNTTIFIEKEGSRWQIRDKENKPVYLLKDEENQLNIYEPEEKKYSLLVHLVKHDLKAERVELDESKGRIVLFKEGKPILYIPVDSQGRMLINFAEQMNITDDEIMANEFRNISLLDLIESHSAFREAQLNDIDNLKDLSYQDKYQGRIALVGLTIERPSVLPTPQGKMRHLLFQANALNTILSQSFITRLGKWENLVLLFFLCLLTAVWIVFCKGLDSRSLWLVFPAFLIGLPYGLIGVVSLEVGWWIDLANPLLAIGLCCAVMLGYKYVVDQRKHLQVQVAAAKAAEIAAVEQEKRQQAEWAAITIRGFAHNLKNLVNFIPTYCSNLLLEWSDSIPNPVTEQVKEIQKMSGQMVQDLGDLHNATTGEIKHEPFDLVESLNFLILQNVEDHPRWCAKIHIHRHYPDNLMIKGDKHKLFIAFTDLIRNACKAMGDSGGTLTLRIAGHLEHVLIEIEDTGQGIPEDKLTKIFQLGYSLTGGTGFGLWIAQRIIESLHRGQISIRSKVGVGTTVQVRLPIQQEVSN